MARSPVHVVVCSAPDGGPPGYEWIADIHDVVRLSAPRDVPEHKRVELAARATKRLAGETIASVLAAPQTDADVKLALAVAGLSEAPFGLMLTHDRFQCEWHNVSASLRRAFEIADVVFAPSPALRDLCASAFQRRIVLLAPAVKSAEPGDVFDPGRTRAFALSALEARGAGPDGPHEAHWRAMGVTPSAYAAPNASPHVHPIYREISLFARRLRDLGWKPDFIVDVGASSGVWSWTVYEAFPEARYFLCDPLFERYNASTLAPNMERVQAAVSDKPGTAHFTVTSDLYGSSLLDVANQSGAIEVPVTTVDAIVAERGAKGRCMIKVDVQFAEHLVLDGALETLHNHCDVLVLETTLHRVLPEAWTLTELTQRLVALGFRMFEQVGCWRDPVSGEAVQYDFAFVRDDFALAKHSIPPSSAR